MIFYLHHIWSPSSWETPTFPKNKSVSMTMFSWFVLVNYSSSAFINIKTFDDRSKKLDGMYNLKNSNDVI